MRPSRLLLLMLVTAPLTALATPALRYQVDQRGNFVLFGNTLGIDCQFNTSIAGTDGGIPLPVVGTVGDCGSSLTDSAPDVFWRSDAPDAGQAEADTTVTPEQARSTAVLILPTDAVVTYARLYWAARTDEASWGTTATIERPGAFSTQAVADQGIYGTRVNGSQVLPIYQSSADVTALVQQFGVGAYRVGNIDTVNIVNADEDSLFIGWNMVVFYSLPTNPPRQLTLFDGMDQLGNGVSKVSTSITGFLVPPTDFDARLGVVSYEGDVSLQGDQFFFNDPGTDPSHGLSHGPATQTNFFNGSRTLLGVPVSNVGDLPQLTGWPGSTTGVDAHVLDVTSHLTSGDTTASVVASTNSDYYILGVFVTAIATLKPVFTDTFKNFLDINGGDIRKGDVIQYDISTHNTGNADGANVLLEDPLPAEVTYVPGSLQIVSGANAGPLTDASGDDVGEYDAASRTVRVWLGSGAVSGTGGAVPIDASASVRFQVTLNVNAGQVENQGRITATGTATGTASAQFVSDSTGKGAGVPTVFGVDECSGNSDCPADRPLCDKDEHPHVCVSCLGSSDCRNPTPVCDTETHACAGCAQDSDCGDPSLPLCSKTTHACAAPPATAADIGHFEGGGCGGCSSGLGRPAWALATTLALLLRRRRGPSVPFIR